MSSPSITDLPTLPADATPVSRFVVAPIHRLAFWAAIVLPFLHVPLLVSGLESETQVIAFAFLLACNVVALVLGHPDLVE